jgi:hypothetical protein
MEIVWDGKWHPGEKRGHDGMTENIDIPQATSSTGILQWRVRLT